MQTVGQDHEGAVEVVHSAYFGFDFQSEFDR
jgi:hypothetical protein